MQQKIKYFDTFDSLNYSVVIIDNYLLIWVNQKFLTLQGISKKSFTDIGIRQIIQIKLSDAIKSEQYIFEKLCELSGTYLLAKNLYELIEIT